MKLMILPLLLTPSIGAWASQQIGCFNPTTGATFAVARDADGGLKYAMNEILAQNLVAQGSSSVEKNGFGGQAVWDRARFSYFTGPSEGFNLSFRSENGGMLLNYITYSDSQARKKASSFYFNPGECR